MSTIREPNEERENAALDDSSHAVDAAAESGVLRQLDESEERFRVIAETIPVGILISRASDGAITFANRKLSDMYRLPADQFMERTTLEFYVDLQDRDELLRRLREQSSVQDFELQTRRADGTTLWVSVSARLLICHGEDCLLGALLDITARKEAEDALREERKRLRRLLDLQEQERRLMAYELHDGLVQDMTAAKMFLEALGPAVTVAAETMDETLTRCRAMLTDSIAEARRLINGLRPPVLEMAGLVDGIESLIEEVTGRSGLLIEFQHNVTFDRLATGLEMAIYRIVQESLNNVWKHSRSPRACVELAEREDWLTLTVRDWGVGFDTAKPQPGHYGLEGIHERVRLLGGRCSIESAPSKGTRIHVEVPMTVADAD
ncbi:MAG: PAS domain S-box protein [Planctomycetales bacterium]|nr:PAS domain S-box protein [Planctomycetales bacterium]